MLYLNEIVEGKIYRKPVKFPRYIDKDAKLTVKDKGCLIYMMTPNFGDALDYLSEERYFKNVNNVFNSYYMDTVYKVRVYNSKVYKNRYAYKSLVSKAKSTYPKIKRVYLKPADYKGLNLFYDMGLYNSIFRTLAKNLGDDDMNILNKKNLNECLYDPTVSINTLDEIVMTEAYLQNSLVNTNPESYRFQPARLSTLYFDFLKTNVFDKPMTEYKNRTLILPVDMWLSVDEVPKVINDFNVKHVKNIAMYIINWLGMGKFKDMPEMTIMFTANGAMVKRSSHNTDKMEEFLQLLVRMLKLKDPVGDNKLGGVEENIPTELEQTEEITKDTVKNSIVDAVVNLYNSNKNVVGFTGEAEEVVVNANGEEEGKVIDLDAELVPEDEIASDTVKVVTKVADEAIINNPEASPEDIINIVDTNAEAIKAIDKMKKDMLVGRSNASLKRDAKLREEFLDKKIRNGLTVKQLMNKKDSPKVEASHINRDILNKDLNQIAIHNFDKTYRETMKEKDLYSIAYAFAKDKDIDLIPKKVEVEDTSDKFNAKETVTIEFEDSNRVRHKFVVDVPKLIDDRFLYINGGRKIMNKQLVLLPITKTKPNTVIVTTNYNKLTMERVGANVSPGLEKLKKMLALFKQPGLTVKIGSNRHLNTSYMRSIEYDELAARFMTVNAINKNGNLYMNFNIDKMYEFIESKKLPVVRREDIIPFGIQNNTNILYVNNTNGHVMVTEGKGITDTGMTLVEFMYGSFENIFGEAFTKEFGDISVGKKYIYTKVIIMKKAIALGLLLAYSEGSITGLLKKLGITYEISTTAPRFDTPIDKMKVGILRFADCYLVYDARQYRNTLLLEGLNDAPLRMHDLSDFDNKDTYIDIFENLLGSKTIANAFDNFRLNMIDPITKEVLEELGYPTDYVEVLAFANGLLEDNAYKLESDMSLYRMRSGELINAYIYKTLADAYGTYRITSNNKNPVKVSVARDTIIKQIMTAPNVEEYSVLNPIIELDKTRTVSFKGLSGLNLEQAYTIDKRVFNPSMLGILGSSTAYSGAVGITRRLTLDANVKSVRGYLQTTETEDIKNLTAKQLFTAAEALNPFVPNHDDAARVLMASTQAGHMVPVENTNKLLIGNGTDKIIANVMTDDYSFKAKKDGVVAEINTELETMVIKYKDGTTDVINIGAEMAKNSSSGFYIDNRLVPVFKKGDKVKEGDIVANNTSYFGNDMIPGQVSYKPGTLAKVAIHSAAYTIEDATGIGEHLSEKMATSVVMPKQVVLGPNSNVDFMCKIGDMLDVNDPLLIFDESFDSPEINKMLAKMSDQEGDAVKDIGKHKVKSKYAASIIDIKIYYTCEFDELSDSLKAIVKKYNAKVNSKKALAKKYNADKFTIESKYEPTEKITPDSRGKVKGVDLENGVMIEFYQKYRDPVGIGDKIIYYTALKGIVSKIFPKDLSPFSEFRPEEPIDAICGPIGIGARMTTSIETVSLGNKVLIELKRKCKELAYGK